MQHGDYVVSLFQFGNLFYAPMRLQQGRPWSFLALVEIRWIQLSPVQGRAAQWVLFEWCCEQDSLLSAWFLRNHQGASRLGLPTADLNNHDVVLQVLADIREVVASGRRVFLWAALPCRFWSSWQRINIRHGTVTHAELEAGRRESRNMLREWCFILEQVFGQEDLRGYVEAAFEWPRGAQGWMLPEVAEMIRLWLPVVCD